MNSHSSSIRIGISSCLLGQKVRYDGGHKKDRFLTDVLGNWFEWIPVCPEFEAGMGIPREPIRLVGSADAPELVAVKSGENWTSRMRAYSTDRTAQLDSLNLSGYIFKSDSPSCGMERVKIYTEKGMPSKSGRGLFAAEFMKRFPLIPAEEEGRLNDIRLRENFIVRVFSYHRLRTLFDGPMRMAGLVHFHTVHKYLMLAHSPEHYAKLGRLVAGAKKMAGKDLREQYAGLFMEGLSVKTTTRKNVNVLHHIIGFLKDVLNGDEKKELLAVIDDYHHELVPLIVPLTLIRHYITRYSVSYILDQVYLQPHPRELMLRNHV